MEDVRIGSCHGTISHPGYGRNQALAQQLGCMRMGSLFMDGGHSEPCGSCLVVEHSMNLIVHDPCMQWHLQLMYYD